MTRPERAARRSPSLDPDTWVVLDPAVRVVKTGESKWFLCNEASWTVMVLPPVPALVELLDRLRTPARVADVVRDVSPPSVGRAIVRRLLQHGHGHRLEDGVMPSAVALRALRASWRARRPERELVETSLEAPLPPRAARAATPRDLLLRIDDLAGREAALTRLADAVRAGDLGARRVQLATRLTSVSEDAARALVRMDATIDLARWPLDRSTRRRAERLAEAGAALRVVAAAEDLDRPAQRRLVTWSRAARVGAVVLDPGDGDAALPVARALESSGLDVQVLGWPDACWLSGLDVQCDVRWRRVPRPWVESRLAQIAANDDSSVTPQTDLAEALDEDEALVPVLAELAGARPGATLVDVCGGLGRVARRFAPFVGAEGTVVVVDRDPLSLERGRRLAEARGCHSIRFRRGWATLLPLPAGSADGAFIFGAIDFFEPERELGQVLEELVRVVRPGGRVLVHHPVARGVLGRDRLAVTPAGDLHQRLPIAFARAGLEQVTMRFLGSPLVQSRVALHTTANYAPPNPPWLLDLPSLDDLPTEPSFHLNLIVSATRGSSARIAR